MLKQCLNKVRECFDNLSGQGTGNPDFPFGNFSSEAPEVDRFRRFVFGDTTQDPYDPIRRWNVQGCQSMCVSEESEEEALLCAARQAIICANNPSDPPIVIPGYNPDPWTPPGPNYPPPGTPGGGTGGNPNPGGGGGGGPTPPGDRDDPPNEDPPGPGGNPIIYYSAEASCTVACPDGSTFTKTIAAGKFVALTQALADRQANDYACQQARAERLCFVMPEFDHLCGGFPVHESILVGGGVPPYSPDISGLPPGINAAVNETGTIINLTGAATAGGTYNPKIDVTDANGNLQTRTFPMNVFAIEPMQGEDEEIKIKVGCEWKRGFNPTGPWDGPEQNWHTTNGVMDNNELKFTPTSPGTYAIRIDYNDGVRSCFITITVIAEDCASPAENLVDQTSILSGAFYNVTIPGSTCSKTYHIKTTGFRLAATSCGCCFGTISVNVFNAVGVEIGGWIAGSNNPFPADINQFVVIPPVFKPVEEGGGCQAAEVGGRIEIRIEAGQYPGCPNDPGSFNLSVGP